ncbi:hypothetical protein [Corynebacterium heidelbergense]|uniref:hypothetical protein n=1 Tax=Corynebacterium heidelbergense TaxID=2055947 RepID=UPI002359A165|nr:hypothetical protein [Corynebacterium heidelbergense]
MSRAETAARDAEAAVAAVSAARDEAVAAAGRVGSAEAVTLAVEEVSGFRDEAVAARDEAVAASGRAVAADESAGVSAAFAADMAGLAEGSSARAEAARDEAVASAGRAGESESKALAAEGGAVAARDAAAGSASAAAGSADVAAGSASSASDSADRAESAAQTAESGAPDATASVKGLVQLSGDLGGTADAPTVPGLAGKADLVGGHVPTSQLPAVALTKPTAVSDRAGMLALDAQEGDVAVIAAGDDRGTYMLGEGPASEFDSWMRLAAADAAVSSVNGQTGVVNLGPADVGAAGESHTHTIGQVDGLRSELDGKFTAADASAEVVGGGIPRRRSNGNLDVPTDPVANAHATSKAYVDNAVAGRAPASHRHATNEIDGFSDDAASAALTASLPIPALEDTLVRYGSDIRFSVLNPVEPDHPATKAYVDSGDIPLMVRDAILWRSDLKGAASTKPQSANWGTCELGLETEDRLNTDPVWDANHLFIQHPGTYRLSLSGSRGGGAGKVSLCTSFAGKETEQVVIQDTTAYTSKTVDVWLDKTTMILCRWNGYSGNNFSYRVQFELIR